MWRRSLLCSKYTMGIAEEVYPNPKTYALRGTDTTLDHLTVRHLTRALTPIIPPACESKWDDVLGITLPWGQVWRAISRQTLLTPPKPEVTRKGPINPNNRNNPNNSPTLNLKKWQRQVTTATRFGSSLFSLLGCGCGSPACAVRPDD